MHTYHKLLLPLLAIAILVFIGCKNDLFLEAESPPQLVYPEDGIVIQTSMPEFSWTEATCINGDVTCAYNYIVNIDGVDMAYLKGTVYQPLNGLEPGEHTWQIIGQNYFQYVRSETYTFTVELASGKPYILYPTTTQSEIPIDMAWTATDYTIGYRIEIASDSDFTNLILNDSDLTEPSYTITSLADGIYYWRITSLNEVDDLHAMSDIYELEIDTGIYTPEVPIPLKPTVTQTTLEPTLEWQGVSYAASYRIEIASDSNFTTIVDSHANITTLACTTNTLSDGTYYWRVIAVNSAGAETQSISKELEIDTVPNTIAPPSLYKPTITQTTDPPTFEWIPGTDDQSYTFELATDSDFTSIVLTETGITDTTFTPSGALGDGAYYWHVIATDSASQPHSSADWMLIINTSGSTGVIPPSILEPTVGACTDTPIFSWTSVDTVDHYHFMLSSTTDFAPADIVHENDTLGSTTYTIPSTPNNSYYWKVVAHLIDTTTVESNAYLVVLSKIPEVPNPACVSSVYEPNPVFEWDAVSEGSYYELQIATDSDFTEPVLYSTSGLTDTTYQYPESEPLLPNDMYYFRVRRVNELCSMSPWHSGVNFEIEKRFFVGCWGGLYYSEDVGQTFTHHTDIPNSNVRDIMVHGDEVWVAVQSTGVYKSVDRGVSFSQVSTFPVSGGYCVCGLEVSPGQYNIYVAPGAGTTMGYYSTDGGTNWTGVNSSRIIYGCFADDIRKRVFFVGKDESFSNPRLYWTEAAPWEPTTHIQPQGSDDAAYAYYVSRVGNHYIGMLWGSYSLEEIFFPPGAPSSYSYMIGYDRTVSDYTEWHGNVYAAGSGLNGKLFRASTVSTLSGTNFNEQTWAVGTYADRLWVGGSQFNSTYKGLWSTIDGTTFTKHMGMPDSNTIAGIQHED